MSREVDGKTKETRVFGLLLSGMDLAGVVVTADATHTQRAHARHLVENLGADFVLCFKDNRPTLFAQFDALPWTSTPAYTTTDTGHGVRAGHALRVMARLRTLAVSALRSHHHRGRAASRRARFHPTG